MNSHKIVTVCSSDTGYSNSCNNYFQSDRRSLSRGERRFVSKERPRIRSAPLSSVLQPVSYREFRNNLPLLVTRDQQVIMNDKRGSMDSDTLRKEINSAVLLLESRNEVDMTRGYSEKYHYKVHHRHQLSQSAQRTIERRVQITNPRWESAKISRDISSGVSSKKCHLRMLSANEASQSPSDQRKNKASVEDTICEGFQRDVEPNLIISSSNSLTNFITIDDISGVKKHWIKGKEKYCPNVEDVRTTITCDTDSKPMKMSTKGRDDILRQYMDVYMHWRAFNGIEEHDHLINGKTRDNKSAKIRYSTPKERLEQFKNSINERQTLIRRKSSLYTSGYAKESHLIGVSVSEVNDPMEPLTMVVKESTTKDTNTSNSIKDFQNVSEVIVIHEIEKDSNSDAYSEIDWLECEDI